MTTRRFDAGHDFATAQGLKTGQNLEDMLELAEPRIELVDDTTITLDPTSKEIKVKDGGIDTPQLADGSVTPDKLAIDSGDIGDLINLGAIEAVYNGGTYDSFGNWALGGAVYTGTAVDALCMYRVIWAPQQSSSTYSGVIIELQNSGDSLWYFYGFYQALGRTGANAINTAVFMLPRNWNWRISKNSAEAGNPILLNVIRQRFQ